MEIKVSEIMPEGKSVELEVGLEDVGGGAAGDPGVDDVRSTTSASWSRYSGSSG
ncbi:MAG: hypothetical protein HZC51_03750 [Nitrospirae bacterium]|nr:hypothetical protein [Nitrospirota bacterium]